MFGGALSEKYLNKLEFNLKHATTNDHDGHVMLDSSAGYLRHLLLSFVQ